MIKLKSIFLTWDNFKISTVYVGNKDTQDTHMSTLPGPYYISFLV